MADRRVKILLILLVCALALIAITVLATQIIKSGGSAGDDLRSLEEDFFTWKKQDAPEFTTSTGDHSHDSEVDDFSMESLDARRDSVGSFIDRLNKIVKADLTRAEMYSYYVFNDTLHTFYKNYRWRHYGPLNPINFLEGDQIDPAYSVAILRLDSRSDFDDYISRLNLYHKKFNQYITRFRAAVLNNNTYHMVSVDKVPNLIAKLVVPVESSIFYMPFRTRIEKWPAKEREELQFSGRRAVGNVIEAFTILKKYIETEYMQHTRPTYGIWGWKDGRENYRACLKWHISVDMTPEEVHQKGLDEVARISGEIQKIMRKRHFSGTIAEFYKDMQAQPKYHRNSTEELLDLYKYIIYHRIYPQLWRVFKDIPKLNVSVELMPNDGPGGQYIAGTADGSRQGVFQVNLKNPNETNTFSMMSLTLHETLPGHHLQFTYAQTANLPEFQKKVEYDKYFQVPYHFPFYSAYTEGWALYAESLGEYLGIYKDDDELLGRYGDEIFRACRLVVDTGIHYMKWSRDSAIQYMADRTPMARQKVAFEIDRYITWPGQACAYKIGELKIKELRSKAMKALGTKFDIRDFHNQILINGPVPLSLLEVIIDNWIRDVSESR